LKGETGPAVLSVGNAVEKKSIHCLFNFLQGKGKGWSKGSNSGMMRTKKRSIRKSVRERKGKRTPRRLLPMNEKCSPFLRFSKSDLSCHWNLNPRFARREKTFKGEGYLSPAL